MMRKIHLTLAAIVIALTMAIVEPAAAFSAPAHHQSKKKPAAKRRGHKAKGQKKVKERAVSYVCPMHPDIREKSRGTCPKCLMDLVATPPDAKVDNREGGSR